ncbi:MAG TPA: AMP-binding protein [Candidatus Cryptobacteroides intestinipullorum]|nr:AMP-binding protein [Candidatus Cryptobacteroides intestinipullorum]
MNFIYKKILKLRERYIDTLAKLYEYSTLIYEKNKLSVMLDSDMSYTYGSFKKKCDEISRRLSRYGIGAGDKVAILSQNMPNWTVAMFSLVPFGRISVPILPDSSENEVTNILNHSGSKAIFISKRLLPKLSKECSDKMDLVIDIETFEIIKRNDDAFTCDGKTAQPNPDDIATIIYTSGTTGNAKGVMLSHRNLCQNIIASLHAHKCTEKDVWLSILPMAHTYELSIGVLYPIFVGACVYYIQKPPTPTVLLSAMKTVRPTVMLSVPLIIEKIYKNSVIPTIRRSRVLRWMRKHTPSLLYRLIGMKLKATFGGRLKFFGIGGSKLDIKVEEFLKKARFPYAIGYGLTETAPLICNAGVKYTKPGSTGVAAYGVTVRLLNVNPETGEGEIVCKGDNVMLGYYKDPERTRSVFTDDGWFRTNDLATVDEKGRYYIKGRLSNMILGPSGENIYPEEIESVINNMDDVNESIVLERNGRLVALVQFNDNIINWNQEGEDQFFEKLQARKEAIMNYVNRHVNKSSKINDVEVVKGPFEKTATQKIRRFKYKKDENAADGKPDESRDNSGQTTAGDGK